MGSEKLLRLVSRTRPDPDVELVRTRVAAVVDVGRRAMSDSTGAMVLPDVARWRDAAPELVSQLEQPARAAMTFVQRLEAGMVSLPEMPVREMPLDVSALPRLARGTTPPSPGEPELARLARGSAPQLFADPSLLPTRDGLSDGTMALPLAEQVASPLAALDELARGRAPRLTAEPTPVVASAATTSGARADVARGVPPGSDAPRSMAARAELARTTTPPVSVVQASMPALRDAVAGLDLDREGVDAVPFADGIEQLAQVPARVSLRPPLPALPAAQVPLTSPWRARPQADAVAVTEEAAVDERRDAAQRRIESTTARGEDPTPIVADEVERTRRAETAATTAVQRGERRHRRQQQARRRAAARRAANVRRNAQRAAARRRAEARRRHAANVARVRAQLQQLQQQQLQRIENLRATERQRITAQLQREADTARAAAEQERRATILHIQQQLQAVQAEIQRRRTLVEQTRVQRELAFVRAHDTAVTTARTQLADHVANLTTLGEQGAAGLRATGQHEAQQLRETARREASAIEATGRRLAARAESEGLASVPPERRAQVRARNRARARQLVAQHAARVRARIARGEADARRTIAGYEARAVAFIARTNQMIETARQQTAARIAALGQRLQQERQRLVLERDRWFQLLDLQARAFFARAVRELQQLQVYFAAQMQAIEREHRERFQAAIRALENDFVRLRADVTRRVLAQIAALQRRLQGASAEELARIEQDLTGARVEIERQIGRISERANREVQTFEIATRQRTQAIRTRGRQAREAIRRMGDTARANAARTAQTAQRTMGRREQPPIRRDNAGWQALDRENAERYRVQNDESYRLRRYARTGEVEITADNADQTRLALIGATRGRNDSSRIFQTLATRTPEELRVLFADEDFRQQFLRDLGRRDRALVEEMMAARSPERVRALALQWAADGGLTGIGTDHEVMRRVFAATTNDAERAELGRQYQMLDARAATAVVGRQMPGRTIDQMIVDETRWSTTRTADRNLLRAQMRGDETEIAAYETIAAYQGGGYFGIGSDDDRVLRVRDDIRRRYAGPHRTAEEAQRARRDEAVAIARLDQISRDATGRSLRELDAGETSGPVEHALAASTNTVEVPADANNPGGARRTVFRPDWTQFRARVAESGAGADYDTRRIELAYAESTPDERRAINEQFARNHNGMTFEQYVQRNMGVSRRMERDGRMIETTDSHAGIDRRAALELSRDGELRSDTLVLQAQYGRGRGGEQDRAAIDRRLGTLSDGELRQLQTDYRRLVVSLGLQQNEIVTRVRDAIHQQRYVGIDPMARFSAWAAEQTLDTISGPSGDLIRDLRATGTARQHRLWSYLLTNGRADTPAEQIAQDDHMLADLGPAPRPGTINSWLEGWEGRAARRHAANLRAQYARLQADGTASLTAEQATQQLGDQLRSGRITQAEYQARLSRLAQFGQTADRSRAAQDATVQGRSATLRTVATTAGQVVTVAGGIVLTVASGGTLTAPYIAAISAAAGGLTTIGISYATLGDDYSRRDFMTDASSTIVSAVGARVIPTAALERYAQQMVGRLGVSNVVAQEILAAAIVSAGTAPATELTAALLDEGTYVGSPSEIRRRLLERIGGSVTSGAISGVRDYAGGGIARRIRDRNRKETETDATDETTDPDRDPPEPANDNEPPAANDNDPANDNAPPAANDNEPPAANDN